MVGKINNMTTLFFTACLMLTTACGFQLRGHTELPSSMEKIYVQSDASSLLLRYLRQSLVQAGVQVVSNIDQATAVLTVSNESQNRSVQAVNEEARVREYKSSYSVTYSVVSVTGEELLPPRVIELQRDYSFNENEVLAKERERISLVRDMQAEAVQAMLRQIRNRHKAVSKQ